MRPDSDGTDHLDDPVDTDRLVDDAGSVGWGEWHDDAGSVGWGEWFDDTGSFGDGEALADDDEIGGDARWTVLWAGLAVVVLGLVVIAVIEGRTGDRRTAPEVTVTTTRAGGGDDPPPAVELARLVGVSMGGADFGIGENLGVGSGDRFSNVNPGSPWSESDGGDYRYPDRDSLRFLSDRGVQVVRLTVRWERIQPDLRGDLHPAELTRLHEAVLAADEVGIDVIPTLMNYGAYWLDDEGRGVRHPIGSPEVPVETFARTWSLLATELGRHDNVAAYALMNEPVDLDGGSAQWEEASSAAADAIRDVDGTTPIAVPTYRWSNVHRVTGEHPNGPWMDDRARPVIYEAHHYFSSNHSGDYGSYQDELDRARAEGWGGDGGDALVERSLAELAGFVRWLDGEQGWIGEVGWPNDGDVEQWNALGGAWFDAAADAGLWVTAWTTGAFWRNDYHLLFYRSSSGAGGNLDQPTAIATVLEAHL